MVSGTSFLFRMYGNRSRREQLWPPNPQQCEWPRSHNSCTQRLLCQLIVSVQEVLGMLFFFDNGNPTGRYTLDMSQPVHRVVLMRLLHSSVADGAWKTDPARQNFRNLVVSGQKVVVTNPTLVVVPRSGIVHLDYLQVCFATCSSLYRSSHHPQALLKHCMVVYRAILGLKFGRWLAGPKLVCVPPTGLSSLRNQSSRTACSILQLFSIRVRVESAACSRAQYTRFERQKKSDITIR